MSWLEKIKNDLVITCGDGKKYTPNYLNAKKTKDYNISQFNFPNISGTLVKRKAPRGRVYPIEIIFQGENHLDVASDFESSGDDPRPWVISHPYYDDITVQPSSLEFDNTKHNVSRITGNLLETIEKVRPSTTESPVDKVVNQKAEVDEVVAASYADNVVPTPSDVASLQSENEQLYTSGQTLSTGELGSEYFDAFNTASGAIANATNEPLTAMRRLQSVITAPSLFKSSVEDQIGLLTSQFQSLVDNIENVFTPNQKRQFQATGGTIMTTIAQSAVLGNYNTTDEVVNVIGIFVESYNLYIESIDSLQTDNGGSPDSYVPDMQAINGIEDVVNESISSLFDIALNSQQERFIYLSYDSNPILLTHRFYGLDSLDENLERFVSSNNLTLDELILIQAGRRIVYYV